MRVSQKRKLSLLGSKCKNTWAKKVWISGPNLVCQNFFKKRTIFEVESYLVIGIEQFCQYQVLWLISFLICSVNTVWCLFQLRGSKSSKTGFTPAKLMMGRDFSMPLEFEYEKIEFEGIQDDLLYHHSWLRLQAELAECFKFIGN